ncbi:MAG: DUF512 domain-containing protein [Anaerobutyricum sp.]|nr:DUF512 domain-containing protein [Eubacterium sp.]MDY6045778.1 DUF512 domain-containing protein [Anaerobutyricum sp.]
MGKQFHVITAVEPGSIAEECGLEPGDRIARINGNEIEDIFDYQYYIQEDFLEVQVLTKDDEECTLEIEKEEDEDLGIEFESSLMDEYHSCCNKCVFCFIDQMPPGMRETLYFKDDDSRLSFLQGNYITLTNMKDKDIDRIIRYHLAPINISVHTTNPELRCQMLHNRFAGDVLQKIKRLSDAGIPMNSQIVLCKGINDGEELDRTIRELGEFLPYMESLSVVPVGLTKFRDNLPKLDPFTKEDALKVLEQIQGWQKHFKEKYNTSFVHASDEWFILAENDFPPEEYYEGYGQLENGVGMMRLLITEVENRLAELEGDSRERKVSIATAKLAYPTIVKLAQEVQDKYPNIQIQVYCITNHFFGEKITVTGLLTGQDIIAQLKNRDLGEELFLPSNVLKADEDIFLDDISLKELSDSLQVPVNIIQSEGEDFVNKIIDYFK